MTQDKTEAEQIISQCLTIDDYLKTIKKALMADGEDVQGFNDHYSELIQQVIDLNWHNHDTAYELSHKDYKLEKIREMVT